MLLSAPLFCCVQEQRWIHKECDQYCGNGALPFRPARVDRMVAPSDVPIAMLTGACFARLLELATTQKRGMCSCKIDAILRTGI
ncbi:hypothetical protein NOVOSPHI9U_370030 [Novosphingobium sp. 9U]|nr:hypothetical protein NOVOSPHI9U_370030 [Novosphingobium sp. 9U]